MKILISLSKSKLTIPQDILKQLNDWVFIGAFNNSKSEKFKQIFVDLRSLLQKTPFTYIPKALVYRSSKLKLDLAVELVKRNKVTKPESVVAYTYNKEVAKYKVKRNFQIC